MLGWDFKGIRKFPKKRKRRIKKKLKLKIRFKQFQYTIHTKPQKRYKRPYNFRIKFKFLAKTLRFFYSLRKTKSSLRKLFTPLHKPVQKKNNSSFLERRADILFFRANFVDTIKEARIFIKRKQLCYLIPKKHKRIFINQQVIFKPYTQIPLFSFFKLSPFLNYKRKLVLFHALKSKNKLYGQAPKWIFFDTNLC